MTSNQTFAARSTRMFSLTAVLGAALLAGCSSVKLDDVPVETRRALILPSSVVVINTSRPPAREA